MATKDEIKTSEVKMEKATEVLWKIIWFCFYMVFFPAACSVIVYSITNFIVIQVQGFQDIHFVFAFTILTLMFSIFFFFIGFDRYRNNPFFQNRENNLSAKIHIPFLVTIASVAITPIIELFTDELQTGKFGIFPLISFIVMYNITWFYFYFKPIDVFNYETREFEHFKDPLSIFTALCNIVVIINYIIQIVFLTITSFTLISWIYILITNLGVYFFLFFNTKSIRNKIVNAIKENKRIISDLLKYKCKYVSAFVMLAFSLLIQIVILYALYNPFLIIFTSIEIIVILFTIILVIMIFLKIMFYIYFYYSPEREDESTEEATEK